VTVTGLQASSVLPLRPVSPLAWSPERVPLAWHRASSPQETTLQRLEEFVAFCGRLVKFQS